MPADLKDQLDAAAIANNRSLTAEITHRLAFSLYAHEHAYLIRALLDLQASLLAGKYEIEIPSRLQMEIQQRAKQRGVPPQQLLITLLLEAINELDDRTELGLKFERRLREIEKRKDE